ncbi:hypothetical protein ACFY0P_46895 [Streptomyces sp. NPDC001714]|uniref:hypothetical protein n=1 Tax=Streptomyces sp. NPDC001714 TaxID=3364603 RepID=UPI0036781A99
MTPAVPPPEGHWHAYTYTGPWKPEDRAARAPASPAPPLLVRDRLRKPRALLAATFTEPGAAPAWLARETAEAPPLPTALPAATVLAYARERLPAYPYDLVTRYYTASTYVCRDLVWCEGAPGACPGAP